MAMPGTLQELELARVEANQLIRKRGRLSAGAALIPLPGADTLADIVVFSNLIESISERFGLTRDQLAKQDPAIQRYVLLVAGQIGSDWIGRLVTKQVGAWMRKRLGSRLIGKTAIRFVPIAGQAVAAFLSYRVVVKLGESHVEKCYRVVRSLIEQAPIPQERLEPQQ
jgi:hypothetical protein